MGIRLGSGEGIDDLEILKLQKIGVGGVDGTDPVFLHQRGGADVEEEVAGWGMKGAEQRGEILPMVGAGGEQVKVGGLQQGANPRQGLRSFQRGGEDLVMGGGAQELIADAFGQVGEAGGAKGTFEEFAGSGVLPAISVGGVKKDIGIDEAAFHDSIARSRASRSARLQCGLPILKTGREGRCFGLDLFCMRPWRKNSLTSWDISTPAAWDSLLMASITAFSKMSVVRFTHRYIRKKHMYV